MIVEGAPPLFPKEQATIFNWTNAAVLSNLVGKLVSGVFLK